MKRIVQTGSISHWLRGCVSVLPLQRVNVRGALVPGFTASTGPAAPKAIPGACRR